MKIFYSALLSLMITTPSFAQFNSLINQAKDAVKNYDVKVNKKNASGASPSQVQAVNNLTYAGNTLRDVINGSPAAPGNFSNFTVTLQSDISDLSATVNGPVALNMDQIKLQIDRVSRSAMNIMLEGANVNTRMMPLSSYVYSLVEAVGAVSFEFGVQMSAPPAPAIDPMPLQPAPQSLEGVNASKCSVRFTNSWGTVFSTSSEGRDDDSALMALSNSCSLITGSAPASNVTNSEACQASSASGVCLNTFDYARKQDSQLSRFASCTLNFSNAWGDSFSVTGTGRHGGMALMNLWENCKTIAGVSAGSDGLANAEVCRENFTAAKFTCSLR